MSDAMLALPWALLGPEAIVLLTALVLLAAAWVLPPAVQRRALYPAAFAGLFVAAGVTLLLFPAKGDLAGVFIVDGFALVVKLLLLAGTGLVLFLAADERDPAWRDGESDALGLMLIALVGAMVMASAADVALLFVAVETLSIASYALVGLKKRSVASLEAALKYVLTGAAATAFFAFGAAFLVGLTGATDFATLAERLADPRMAPYRPFVYLGFFALFGALTFKISSPPFYLWTPDVYQGAATAVTGFLAVVSKAAGLAAAVRLTAGVFYRLPGEEGFGVGATVALVAALSMLIGNAVALWQSDAKRLLAYSSIAHAGYLLVPLAAATPMAVEQILYYLVAYLFMTLGAFALVEAVARDRGTYDVRAFAGLYHRSPGAAVGLFILMLSFAGIPLTAGFFGKWYILLGALGGGRLGLAAILIVATVISYAYYFSLVWQAFMRPGPTERPLRLAAGPAIVFYVGVFGTLAGALFFGPLLGAMRLAF
ncbi:MAG: NADH-quinone oxidoreductase subunit N [Hydrogenibacillus schlegelii]|uniref:NADH-quinone oxidoreductase subunit N n=1 Tax=Hydrogenibacillus schlegelii TaxID=1484 RepID=A0A947GAS2_HYDSH|nr:NADH-quinone oxidoreductase subunit N [Hydrogenibacillus schlegelii]